MEHNGVGTVIGVIEPAGKRSDRLLAAATRPAMRALDGDTVFQIGSNSKAFVGLLLADMVRRGESRVRRSRAEVPACRCEDAVARPADHAAGPGHATFGAALDAEQLPAGRGSEPDPKPIRSVICGNSCRAISSRASRVRSMNIRTWRLRMLERLLALHAGKEYEALLKERVIDPLGMSSTGIRDAGDGRAPHAGPHGLSPSRSKCGR